MERNNLLEEKETVKEISLHNEISIMDLLEAAKKFLKADDLKNCLHYLNLGLFSPTLDISTKIALMSMNSLAYYKLKDEAMMAKICRKLIKFTKKHSIKSIPGEILLIYIKILQKASQLFEDNNNFIFSCWLLYIAKNIYDSNNLKGDETTYDVIKNGFPKVLKKISDNLNETREGLLKKRDVLKKILNEFSSSEGERSSIKININKPGETYHLVSSNWISNMLVFIKFMIDNETDSETLFNVNNVCLLYFDSVEEDEDDMKKEIMGSYPGPVNNFLLTSSCDSWIDPEDEYTNSYINKEMRENSDYVVIPSETYKDIKNCFGVFNEISRQSVHNENNSLQLEVNLKKIKVLFLNETMREKYKEHIKPKNIQISKFATFGELETKIQRVFKKVMGGDYMEHDLKIYKFDRKSRDMFELILSYMNKNKSHKVIIKELKKSELNNHSLFDLKIGAKDTIIVEAIAKNMIVKPFIRVASENIVCSLCSNKMESSNIVSCENCTQTIYCSTKCKTEDITHSEYHKKISNLYRKKLSLDEISKLDVKNFLDTSSKGGLIGLKNLGNTCFMNAAIQSLSHCEDLTKYILSKSFLDEINKQSRTGPEGKVVRAYYELLHEMWIGTNTPLSPWDFRNIFAGFTNQMGGKNQVDAQEMILFLLDRLHDDVNRVKDNSRVDMMEQKKGESDDDAAKRWWDTHKSRENSIIVDLFHGQLKTKIKCPKCKKETTSYDPCAYLPVTIPDKNVSKVKFKVFPNNYNYKFLYVEIFDVNDKTTVKDVKNKIKESPSFRSTEIDSILLKDKVMISVLADEQLIHDYVFTKIDFSDEVFVDTEIIFCEVENGYQAKNKGDFVTFYISPSIFFEEKYYLLLKYKNNKPLSYPKAFSISKKSRVKDLFIEVYKYYRRAMNDMVVATETEGESKYDTTYYEEFYNNLANKEFYEKDFDRNFLGIGSNDTNETNEGNNLKTDLKDKKDPLFNLFFINNIPVSTSYFFSKPACEYCKSSSCTHCKVNLTLDTKIYEMYATQKVTRPFLLIADFSKFKDGFFKFFDEFIDYNDPKNLFRGELTLYDCFDNFRKEEKFEKEAPWTCVKCEKQVEAIKKTEIYSAPKYLMIQLKRFKLKGHKSLMELVNNKKNETMVYYPMENFEVSSYICGPEKDATYELASIIQHTGGLQGGHYTTLVRNNGKWFEIDDEIMKPIENYNELINQNAYILFYKKTEKKKEISEGVEINSINDIGGE